MKLFRDNASREWTVEINVATIKRVRSLVNVDLLTIVEGKLLEQLYRDPVLLVDVIYAVCKPQADTRGVSDQEFGEGLAGDAIEAATDALLGEVVSFFPNARDRANLGKILETTRSVMAQAREMIEQRLDSGSLRQAAEQALQNAMRSSGAAPASSVSTPAP